MGKKKKPYRNAAIACTYVAEKGSIAAFFETRLQETFELRFKCGYRPTFQLRCRNL